MILQLNQYSIVTNTLIKNNIQIKLKIYKNLKTFQCILPVKIQKYEYKQYNITNVLVNNISNIIVEYNESINYVKIKFFNIIFPDGKKYEENIDIYLEEIIDEEYIDFDNELTLPIIKMILIRQNNHIQFLNNKIISIEKAIKEAQEKALKEGN